MRLFDPWPVFFKREWKRCWPFLTGFAVTGVLITKLTAGFTGKSFSDLADLLLNSQNQSVYCVESDRMYPRFCYCICVSRGSIDVETLILWLICRGRRQELQVRPTTQAVMLFLLFRINHFNVHLRFGKWFRNWTLFDFLC